MKTEYNALDHNKLFGMDKETNITDPIIEYMIDDYNGAYVPPEWLENVEICTIIKEKND